MHNRCQSFKMPGNKGICWCLGGTVPPKISYGMENGGMTLKPFEVDIPMPTDEAELDAKFTELVEELGLDRPQRQAMFSLPPEKKWQIYCSKKREQDDPSSANKPDYYIERVNAMKCVFLSYEDEEIQARMNVVDSLKTALRTQPMSFVLRFIELDGLTCLLNFLTSLDGSIAQTGLHTSVIGCLKALLNNSQGRAHVLAHPNCINVIAQSLSVDNIRSKTAALEILGAVCLVPGGHKKVLHSFNHYQKYAGERTRFQGLINDLDKKCDDYQDNVSLKTATMSFINAALKYGPGQTQLEFRLHLRYEFLMLGIVPIMEKLRSLDNNTLNRHIDFFEIIRIEDEKTLAKRLEVSHFDTKSASGMFELLRKKLAYTPSYQHLQSMLFHLLQLPFGNSHAGHWQVLDQIVQQVTLQTKDGDPDADPLDIDVKKVVRQLANENQMKEFQTKMREVQKENDELASKLSKKEHECEVKIEEKEELMQTLNKIKTKLEKDATNHAEAKGKLAELQQQVSDLNQLVELERMERVKLEHAVQSGSLPDDAKVGLSTTFIPAPKLNGLQVNGAVPPPPPPPMGDLAPPPPPPPPPPSAPGAPPPPPGPSAPSLGGFGGPKKKNVPKPSQPLKSFNWSKIPHGKLKETVWKDIDESKVYKQLDLDDFERNFSAYQGKEGFEDTSKSSPKTVKELSVIDGRRAQNCTILLSKLKMTNKEIATAIWNVDPREEIPKDMCEQLLKFVPTPEETQLLSEHEAEIEQMAKADRFLFEMSVIPHYEERLKSLFYKKKFSERMNDAKAKVEAVLEASKEVYRSRKLKKLLELVLAFGNYMNRGQRGNASGFRVDSLNKIADTRSSIDRKLTLLHYMLQIIEKQFMDILKLDKELGHTRLAAKVNMTELDVDIRVLKTGLADIQKEIDYQKKDAIANGGNTKDGFVSIMSDFLSIATYNFSELEEQVTEMKEKYEKAAKAFAEDPKSVQPDEFFSMFDAFVTSFMDAKEENARFKREKEQEAKRIKAEEKMKQDRALQAMKTPISREHRSGSKDGDNKGDFDDLISALRTGDVFGEEMVKLKRTRKKSVPSAAAGTKLSTKDVSRERVGLEGHLDSKLDKRNVRKTSRSTTAS